MSRAEYTLHCPECGEIKEPEWVIGTRSYSARRLDVPYFMCGRCRVISIDKVTVRQAVSAWRNGVSGRQRLPSYEELYQEMMKILQRVTDYYCQTAGYKRCKFKKIIS